MSSVTASFVNEGEIIEKIMKFCGDNTNLHVYKEAAILTFCSDDAVFTSNMQVRTYHIRSIGDNTELNYWRAQLVLRWTIFV